MSRNQLEDIKIQLLEKRASWYEYLDLEGTCFDWKNLKITQTIKGVRTFLYIDQKKWAKSKFEEQINIWSTTIESLDFVGSKKPRCLWLPTVINNASEISIVAYPSTSVRKLTTQQAIKFVSKHKLKDKIDNNKSYKASIPTGYKYKIHVNYLGKIKLYTLTDWVVCICTKNQKPKLNTKVVFKDTNSITSKIAKITPYNKV